jgi:hypothetical protein
MEKIGKMITIVLWALIIVSAILVVSLVANINDLNDADPDMLNWINANLIWVYILGVAGGPDLLKPNSGSPTDRPALRAAEG